MDSKVISKSNVFYLFYARKEVVRKGGGNARKKMCRISPSFTAVQSLGKLITDSEILKYFVKLRDRKPGIAPPRPPN